MQTPLRLLLVLHDFLPQALAGTELYVQRVAQTLATTCDVALFYSIRDPSVSPSSDPTQKFRSETLDRVRRYQVVVNSPWPPLPQTLTDHPIEACFREAISSHRPHLIHFHHFAFLPLSLAEVCLREGIPYGITLHDYHLACPAGGQLAAHPDGHPCAAPVPQRCAPCYAAFQTRRGLMGSIVGTTAQRLQVPLQRLEGLLKDVSFPPVLGRYGRVLSTPTAASEPPVTKSLLETRALLDMRATLSRMDPKLPATQDLPGILRRRNRARELVGQAAWVASPSRDLAERFRSWGWEARQWELLPNPGPSWHSREPLPPPYPLRLVFLGTLAPHKGLDRVVAAIQALPRGTVHLSIYGNPHVAPEYAAKLLYSDTEWIQFHGVCPPERVLQTLSAAHALILGARWPENAPLTVLEAFAAGRPVIAPRLGGIPELIQHQQNGLLFDPFSPEEPCRTLHRLIQDPAALQRLADGTRPPLSLEDHTARLRVLYQQTLEATDTSASSRPALTTGETADRGLSPTPNADDRSEDAVGIRVQPCETAQTNTQTHVQTYAQAYQRLIPEVSVLIPCRDGGAQLKEVLDALLRQITPWPFEILLLDSGSSDGTLDRAQRLTCPPTLQLRCLYLPSHAFGHGRTRSWMAALARAPLLVYLVQDATPTSSDWLARLVQTFLRSGCMAGHARQVARPDADPGLKARISAHTPPGTGFQVRALTPGESWDHLSPEERLRRCSLDNVCSIFWRQALLQNPFPDVAFAEDLAWGMAHIRQGGRLAYLPEAAVWHSHRRSFWHDLQRSHTEHQALRHLLGLKTVSGPAALAHGLLACLQERPRLGREGFRRQLAELLGQAWSALDPG